ncbi:MAG: hypothetical protein HGA55_08335 [Methanoregulaceae archaeon]|nr:hypothetical protein [Methanoregulaceae archaeon]
MKRMNIALAFTLISCLLIGSSVAGFVNDPTVSNDPTWKALNGSSICPFCYSKPFNLADYMYPTPTPAPVVEPEKPVPFVMPEPLPSSDISRLIDSFSRRQIPSQGFSKHVFSF